MKKNYEEVAFALLKADKELKEFTFVEVNNLFAEYWGYKNKSIVGEKATDVIKPYQEWGLLLQQGLKRSFQIEINNKVKLAFFPLQEDFVGVSLTQLISTQAKKEHPPLILRYDTNLRHIYVDPQLLTVYAVSQKELLNKSFLELNGPPDLFKEAHQILQRALETAQEQIKEFDIILPIGWKKIKARVIPQSNENNKVESLLAIITDSSANDTLDEATLAMMKDSSIGEVISRTPAVLYSYELQKGQPKITYLSDNVESILGHKSEDFIDNFSFWKKCVHPDDFKMVSSSFPAPYAKNAYRFKDKQGNYRWLHDQQKLIESSDGVKTVVGVWWDITDVKKGEAKIKELHDQKRMLLDNIEVQVWYLNNEEEYGLVNQACAEFFGCLPSDLMGQSLRKFLPSAIADAYIDANREIIKSKKTVKSEEWFVNSKGEARLLLITKTPRIAENGEVDYIFCSGIDVTEEKKLQQGVKLREEKLNTIYKVAQNVAFVMTDAHPSAPKILEFSPGAEKIFNYTKEQVLGKEVAMLHEAKDVNLFPEITSQIAKVEAPYETEMKLRRSNGELFPALISIYPLKDDQGENYATLGVSIDITAQKEVEQQLYRKQSHWRGIIESQQDLIVRVDLDNRFTFVNNAYCEKFGKSESELLGQPFAPLIHQDDRVNTFKEMEKLYKPPYRAYLEQRALTVAGWRWIAWEDSAIRDKEGNIIEIQGVGRDITAHKNALAKLQKSEERYRGIVEDQTELICRFKKDGTLTFVNKAYCDYFNTTEEELLGKSFYFLIPQEDRKIIEQNHASLSKANEVVVYEHRVILANQEIRWQQWIDRVFFDDEGEVFEFQAVGRDITEQKRAEAALERAHIELEQRVLERTADLNKLNELLKKEIAKQKQAEKSLAEGKRLLATTLGSIKDGVITVDKQKHISYMNNEAAKITGYCWGESHKEPLEKIFCIIRDEQSAKSSKDPLNEILQLQEKDIPHQQFILFNRQGQRLLIEVKASRVAEGEDESLGYVLAFRDVTRQRKIEAKLSLAQKLDSIGQMAAGIAHEVNSPMQYIGDNAQFLDHYLQKFMACCHQEKIMKLLARELEREDFELDFVFDEMPKAINGIKYGVERVKKIITAMRGFTHVNTNQKSYADLNKSIEAALILSKHEWKYVAKIEKNLDQDIPPVFCNVDEISQVILNMILNSTHAIVEKVKQQSYNQGQIIIETKMSTNHVFIKIIDNGIGIPPKHLNKIFDPFFTTKDVGKGTGQGLAIAYDIIVNKHQGFIEVESASEKTVFIIKLPLVQ